MFENYKPYWLVVSADKVQEVNSFAVTAGFGEGNLGVRLSASGQEPATHFGGHLGSIAPTAAEKRGNSRFSAEELVALFTNNNVPCELLLSSDVDALGALLTAKGLKVIQPAGNLHDA